MSARELLGIAAELEAMGERIVVRQHGEALKVALWAPLFASIMDSRMAQLDAVFGSSIEAMPSRSGAVFPVRFDA